MFEKWNILINVSLSLRKTAHGHRFSFLSTSNRLVPLCGIDLPCFHFEWSYYNTSSNYEEIGIYVNYILLIRSDVLDCRSSSLLLTW